MNDKEIIDQINDLLNKAISTANSGDEDNQLKTEKIIGLYDQIFNLYNQLSSQSQKTMKSQLYIAHRNVGRLYFILNEYEKSLFHLENAKKLSEYKSEEFMIKLWIDHFIVSLRIKLYLKTNSGSYLKNVRGINNSLLNKMDKIESQDLKNEINYNKSLLQGIDRGAQIKTVICFEVPPALPIQENTPINFKFRGINHILKVEIIKNPAAFLESGDFVEITEDKYGLINRSKIKLTIFKYIDPDEQVEIKSFSEKKLHFKILLEAIDALNYFIERYRIITGNYWIEPVFYKMIKNYTFENMFENQEHHVQRAIMEHLTRISPTTPWLKNSEIHDLKICLNEEEIPLWEILLLDAKDYLLRRSFREAIYAINGAFENYLMLKARNRLIIGWGSEKNVTEYLEGVPVYKYHKLKEYMDENTFNQAVKDNKITPYVPPTNQILKECNIIQPFSISRTQLNRLVGKIRKKRNEVMHGVEITDDLETIAFEAIINFEEFIKLF
ncbi:MAG: hypothetical protein ACP5OJ_05960 [Methanothermobacter sp.]